MTTIREVLSGFGKKYIWGLSVDENPKSKVVNERNDGVGGRRETPNDMSLSELREAVTEESLVFKAFRKKNRDTFKNWFKIVDKDGKEISGRDKELVDDFDKKTNIKELFHEGGMCANIYGTGFIEKIYNEHVGTNPMTPINNRKYLIDLMILDPEKITERKKNPNNDKDPVKYPVFKSGVNEEKFIHPSRLEVIRFDKLPNNYFGISTARLLWNIIKTTMNADVACGELLTYWSRGMYDITIDGMQENDERNAEKQVKKHPDYLIHDEKTKLGVVNPTRVEAAPLYDYIYTKISAGVDMPKQILVSGEIVTNNEAGLGAYYSDIENIQNIVFTPIVENIYKELFRSMGRKWEYSIVWNPIFVNELSESKTLQARSYSVTQLINAGVIDNSEGRDMINHGIIELDKDKKIKQPSVPKPQNPSNPNISPQPIGKPTSVKQRYKPRPLTQQEKDMIERMKLKGKIEEELQEERLKEAERKNAVSNMS
jgi:hypothetical protein